MLSSLQSRGVTSFGSLATELSSSHLRRLHQLLIAHTRTPKAVTADAAGTDAASFSFSFKRPSDHDFVIGEAETPTFISLLEVATSAEIT